MTIRELITSAFKKARIISANDTLSNDEASDALDTLNELVSSWANDGLLAYSRQTENFSLTGAQEYTVGSGQTFNTVPFTNIIAMYARQGVVDYDMTSLTDEQYADVTYKANQGTPEYYNYDNGFPTAKLKLWPVPSSSYTLYITSEKPLTAFTLDQTVNLPPGWERALKTNLGLESSAEYGVEPPQYLYVSAKESLGLLKRQVSKARTMDWAPNAGRLDNINSGWNR